MLFSTIWSIQAYIAGTPSSWTVRRGWKRQSSRFSGQRTGSEVYGPQHRNLFAHAPDRLHDKITADYTDMIYAATPGDRRAATLSSASGGCVIAPSRTLEEAGDRLFTFTRLPPTQWRSARTTNAIERLHEEFKGRIKTQTVLP